MSKLDQRITKLVDKVRELDAQRRERNNKLVEKWHSVFVSRTVNDVFLHTAITDRGKKELGKNNIEWSEEQFDNPGYPGLAYEPGNVCCLVCGSTNVSNYMSMGFAPRFAACPKHEDFLLVVHYLKKKIGE